MRKEGHTVLCLPFVNPEGTFQKHREKHAGKRSSTSWNGLCLKRLTLAGLGAYGERSSNPIKVSGTETVYFLICFEAS